MNSPKGSPKPATTAKPSVPGASGRKAKLAEALRRNLTRRKAKPASSSGKEG